MRARTLLAIGMIAIAACANARADAANPYVWHNVTVGAGGFAPNVVFSTAAKGLAYLRTDMGGAYRWDDSTGAWTPLLDGLAEGSYQGVESIAPDPVDPNVLYLAAGMYRTTPAAILRSSDKGTTWTVRPVPFRMGGNEDGRGLGERLAIDPNRTGILYFGSRHDGLQRSDDAGGSWHKVADFPMQGLGLPAAGRRVPTHAGIAFVVIDPASGLAGTGSRTIFVGSADPGARHLFRSDDAGRTWAAVSGGPAAELLPVKAALDRAGRLFVAYDDGIGPNGITRGALWRLDTATGSWTDVTPDKTGRAPPGGYMGLSLDAQHPGTVVVSTVDRWQPGDTVWRSTDAGASWQDLKTRSTRNVSASPFLKLDRGSADMGHWMAGLAIDPFDPRHMAYTTGATVYATQDGDGRSDVHWMPWVKGIEQTAIIALASPTAGAPLISGFGDIAGFVHDDLATSPAHLHTNPYLSNTNTIDYAGRAPAIVVRSGNGHGRPPWPASLAWSGNGGHDWTPLVAQEANAARGDQDGAAAITVSADGRTFIVGTPVPLRSTDHGRKWLKVSGLPAATRAVADKVDPQSFYAIDFPHSILLASTDGGATFVPTAARGLPDDLSPAAPRSRETPYPLLAEPGRAGHLWLKVGHAIFASRDGGRSFTRVGAAMLADLLALGAPAPGRTEPALYVAGTFDGVRGLYRSIDAGERWTRINDDAHQWGLRFRVIEGDPTRFGRLYVGTDGRGILYGDPAGG